jgi:hypothetical protein
VFNLRGIFRFRIRMDVSISVLVVNNINILGNYIIYRITSAAIVDGVFQSHVRITCTTNVLWDIPNCFVTIIMS